jgi:glycosyltransferase involved in cell wall biosynthesis
VFAGTIDAIIPARNEGETIGPVIDACLGCRFVRDVVVVDDGSTDDTAAIAASHPRVRLVQRPPHEGGSKAHAMEAGVEASDADALLFVDADCIGLFSHHLDEICAPFVAGRAAMSLGWFDYGVWNPLVNRFPPTTGQRVIHRWAWDAIPPHKREGFTIEFMINEVIAAAGAPTVSRTMKGVTHRTKRDKFGPVKGWRHTIEMFWDVWSLPFKGHIRPGWYRHYLRGLSVER